MKFSDRDVAELLVVKGADINAKTVAGFTPLYAAADEGHKDIIELLVANGADVNASSKDGFTPLFVAAVGGHRDVAELLIAKGAHVNSKAKDGATHLPMSGTLGWVKPITLLSKKIMGFTHPTFLGSDQLHHRCTIPEYEFHRMFCRR